MSSFLWTTNFEPTFSWLTIVLLRHSLDFSLSDHNSFEICVPSNTHRVVSLLYVVTLLNIHLLPSDQNSLKGERNTLLKKTDTLNKTVRWPTETEPHVQFIYTFIRQGCCCNNDEAKEIKFRHVFLTSFCFSIWTTHFLFIFFHFYAMPRPFLWP